MLEYRIKSTLLLKYCCTMNQHACNTILVPWDFLASKSAINGENAPPLRIKYQPFKKPISCFQRKSSKAHLKMFKTLNKNVQR